MALALRVAVLCAVRLAAGFRSREPAGPVVHDFPNVHMPASIRSVLLASRSRKLRYPEGPMRIPKILHFAWDTPGHSMPEVILKNLGTWRTAHPNWEVKVWDAQSNRRLIQEDFPWFLETYDGLDCDVMRMDAVRLAYMHKFGGVYNDADTNVTRPIDRFLADTDIVFVDRANHFVNYFLASVPEHPFWQAAMRKVMAIHKIRGVRSGAAQTICKTGWVMLQGLWERKFKGLVYPPKHPGATMFCQGLDTVENTKYSVISGGVYQNDLGITHQRIAFWRHPGLFALSQVEAKGATCEDTYPGWNGTIAE